MKITPYVHRQAPELCYFTVNGIRYTEKPMVGKFVNWYKVMTDKKALHPIAEVRKAHFSPAYFGRICTVNVEYDCPNEWLNTTRSVVFKSYSEVLKSAKDYVAKKHPSFYDHNMALYDGSIMPVPKVTIKTTTKYIKA